MSKIEWGGKGFPPVGCECMYMGKSVVTILAHAKDYGKLYCIYQAEKYWQCSTNPNDFKPLKSEREQFISDVLVDIGNPGVLLDLIGKMYDAGYRKNK